MLLYAGISQKNFCLAELNLAWIWTESDLLLKPLVSKVGKPVSPLKEFWGPIIRKISYFQSRYLIFT